MNEEWLLMNFQDFLKKILNGDILIQDQINVVNIRRDTSCNVSFLNHLLSYQNINRENILEILIEIYHTFNETIDELKDIPAMDKMLERLNSEWYETDNLIVIKSPIPTNFFDIKNENEELYQKACQAFDEIMNLTKVENNIPLQVESDSTHPMKKYFDQVLSIFKKTIQELEEHFNETNRVIQSFKGVNLNFFLDLSIKHKQLYLKLLDIDSIEEIPENIHGIFSNYIYVHNLVLKQLIQYYHILDVWLVDIYDRLEKIKIMKQNVENIAYFEEKDTNKKEDDERIVFSGIKKDLYKNLNGHIDTFF
tara:strand:- start:554 stop:1477 length:924 start_codon:yes stop_codon:yes gene_type:complete